MKCRHWLVPLDMGKCLCGAAGRKKLTYHKQPQWYCQRPRTAVRCCDKLQCYMFPLAQLKQRYKPQAFANILVKICQGTQILECIAWICAYFDRPTYSNKSSYSVPPKAYIQESRYSLNASVTGHHNKLYYPLSNIDSLLKHAV